MATGLAGLDLLRLSELGLDNGSTAGWSARVFGENGFGLFIEKMRGRKMANAEVQHPFEKVASELQKGCKVIGFAGSDKKVQYLKEIGYDVAINYKTMGDLDKTLKEAAPNGIDCYFDNIGGEFSSTVIYNMNAKGRVCVCGSISAYNAKESPKARILQPAIIFQRLSIEGFLVFDHKDKYMVAVKQLMAWLNEKKLIYKEHVTNGFENTPKAFQQLFTGENFGKAIVKI
nr:prostaglandin reductase 1-like [Lytechinus pictus]